MTPFMLRVAEIVGTPKDELPELDEFAPMPETRVSRRIATGTGADRQVAIRSLAEQLVSEANAILGQAMHQGQGNRNLTKTNDGAQMVQRHAQAGFMLDLHCGF